MSGEGTSGAAGNGAGGATGASQGNWFDGITGEDLGYIQNRGLDKLDARTAFTKTMQAHREAEKHLGAPANELFRAPKDANDAEGWQRFDDRFGVPKDGKYDFANLKFSTGEDLDESFTGTIAAALKAAHVPANRAMDIAKPLVEYMENADAAEAQERANLLDINRTELKADWGARFTPNMLMVQNMVKTLGLSAEFVNNVEKEAGYTKTMQTLLNLAHKLGEDKFIVSDNGTGDQRVPMSKEQAGATLEAKMNDNDWTKKLQAADAAAVKEFDMLTRMIAG